MLQVEILDGRNEKPVILWWNQTRLYI